MVNGVFAEEAVTLCKNLLIKKKYMTLNDTWVLVKKIVVGILVFLVPLFIIAAILWFIQKI